MEIESPRSKSVLDPSWQHNEISWFLREVWTNVWNLGNFSLNKEKNKRPCFFFAWCFRSNSIRRHIITSSIFENFHTLLSKKDNYGNCLFYIHLYAHYFLTLYCVPGIGLDTKANKVCPGLFACSFLEFWLNLPFLTLLHDLIKMAPNIGLGLNLLFSLERILENYWRKLTVYKTSANKLLTAFSPPSKHKHFYSVFNAL